MTDPIRLLLADDQQMVRAGFRLVLDAQPDMCVVGEANDGAEAVQLVDELTPDVVLMDIRMPVLDGLGATEKIMTNHPEAKILVLTTFDLDEYVHSALRAGASGFMLKDAGPTELLAAIRAVRDGDSVVAPSATRRLIERFIPRQCEGAPAMTDLKLVETLSDREREVLTCVGEGLTNAEIAERLYLAETTVKTHIGHILSKLGLRDRVSMVITAYDAGLVRPGR
ncbi:response regulator transcription factor [Propionibacterium sp. NM47_B9-13]|jgi:DNA-binding NarL/FixJ family response regulator|uniref:DNA-binding response regulator n=2 Tax=Cutibacterium modestum TaxID=2559073 RepID=A0AAD1NX14_9ACTN|nr:response regulator transcription factor [Cutibacterium modestum]TGY30081.1 response regulator transcription factor [Propionibacterium sp. NM47_B9-13]AOH45904.1 DNA-binding response regulator [Cutibacterium modestum]EFS74103.1 response regulator receiver domain protein [Cutibacterium modestum HL037PA2]EFS92685.1 response regulator receiver domain protein [Cutibacterium modestum HL044PA1]EFT15366.1 response regulator receiver domain protein [Cutibacterium modestum HL037PA3]